MTSIVYVDDEQYLTDIFTHFFSGQNYQVNVFTDEFKAIEFCKNTPPDILFIDYRLAQLRGDDVARHVPEHIHKVLVSGDVHIKTKYPFDAFVEKPFKLNDLLQTIEALTHNSVSH
ncbi:response regulator [Pseudoalteromonas sp. SSM20]|uniref:response regulator n=1 Tax=Pseudoalteromonas sp. SSM20 TaxID=3139394 RepID=UPI003BA92A69